MNGTSSTVRRFVWHPAPSTVDSSSGVLGKLVAVVGAPGHAVEAVSAKLASEGATLWHHGDARVPDAIVDLTLAEPFDPERPGAADEALVRTLAVLRHCYQDWAAETDTHRLAYLAVTYLDGRCGYSGHRVHQPLGGIWAGLAKSLHRELPVVTARVVDLPDPGYAGLAEIVAAEVYRGGPAEIGYRDGTRRALLPRAEPAPAPSFALGHHDTVLVCGGGTGIGFELARTLARRGCRVVVTGRAAPPEGPEHWLNLGADAFAEYRRDLIRDAAGTPALRETRRRIGKLQHLRELHDNLRSIDAEGLALRYRPCDLTDPAQAAALIDELGDGITGIVYLAGVDRPARLPSKTDSDFLAGVAVKTTGFLRLVEVVRARGLPLKFFCNSGSLTGRLGGMVGELDYSAANEALARLGLWARHETGLDVFTVCWPLWRGLSVSTNVDAALKYMPAMDPAEGFANWCTELTASHDGGEVVYLGPIAGGMDVTKAGQFPLDPALPGFGAAYPKVFHLGAPERWKPGEHLTSRIRLSTRTTPAAADFHVDGSPAIPVSILLETALRHGEWLVPGPARELTDVVIHPAALRLVNDAVELDRVSTVRDGTVRIVVRNSADRPVADLTVHTGEPRAVAVPDFPTTAGTPALPEPSMLRWKGAVIPRAPWHRHACGTVTASLPHCPPSDLWTAEPAPEHLLPVAALENILRMACAGHDAGPLRIERITVHPEHARPTRLLGTLSGDTWYAVDQSSRTALVLRTTDPRRAAWPS
ncbi:KR domain-containing protein [Amycolatopsis sp. CA-230715]|uniref:KR domain-containing protein n=1 Tax=Amycolatopsis sp. CA-230715 TaxID=2745196 RepID=UPI001C0382C0|nr:KR domain-containing protein [Amycolatopsis sp. CA-230715]QWF85125.1 hypothetical protein HUW46_08579 [Amycolatopsis sp. CA-230715]